MSKAATQAEDYPMNLLDEVARDALHPDGQWEHPFPEDIKGTLAYVFAETLTEREARVLLLRYLDKLTYEEVGKECGVTRERIRQIEQKALRKLRHPLRKNMLITGVRGAIRETRILDTDKEYMKRIDKAVMAVTEIARAATSAPVEFCENLGAEKDKVLPLVLKKSAEELDLSVRAYNCLRRAGIKTIEDITKMSFEQLAKLRNMGEKTAMEVVEKLKKHGLNLED